MYLGKRVDPHKLIIVAQCLHIAEVYLYKLMVIDFV